MNKLSITFVFTLLVITFSNAQRRFIDEWEAQIGWMNFQGDLGERGHFNTTLGNYGGTIGAKVYLNLLDYRRTDCYGCTHLKFNVNLLTGYSLLSYGTSYENINTVEMRKIKAINGHLYFVDLGLNVEYHMSELRNIDFFSSNFFNKFDPYVGVGGGLTFYNTNIESSLGNLEKSPEIVPNILVGHFYPGTGFTPMVNLEVGLRYRFDQSLQFVISNKWRYYLSDKVDGIAPIRVKNLYNDWMFTPSFGVVIFIN